MEHRGGCHCGNLAVHLRLSQALEDMPLRACGCSFCRAHNTRTTSPGRKAVPTDHEGEEVEDRFARRAANWIPAKLRR